MVGTLLVFVLAVGCGAHAAIRVVRLRDAQANRPGPFGTFRGMTTDGDRAGQLVRDVAVAETRLQAVALINEALLEIERDLVALPRTNALVRTALLAGALGAATEAVAAPGPGGLFAALAALVVGVLGAGMTAWLGRRAEGLAVARCDRWNRLARRLQASFGPSGTMSATETGSPSGAAISW
jgi:hypothetical protein